MVATELHPRIQYKTLPITECMTAYEVVVKLVTKFAMKEEDKDPDLFYLNEVNSCSDVKVLMLKPWLAPWDMLGRLSTICLSTDLLLGLLIFFVLKQSSFVHICLLTKC